MCGKGDRHAQVRIVCTGQRLLAIWKPGVLSTEESIFVGTKYFPPVFKSRSNIFLIHFFLDWRTFGMSWEWLFQCSLFPTKWDVLVFSVSKELNNICGENLGTLAYGAGWNGISRKKSRALPTYKTWPFSVNIIPVNNWKYAVRLPAVCHPLRPHPLDCFTRCSNAQRDLHIYITEKCLQKKLPCDWAGKLQRAPTVWVSMHFSQKIYFQFVIHKGREREIGMGSFEVENKVFYSAFSLIEYTWHRLGMAAAFM